MITLVNLKPNDGSKHYPKRVGRGRGSGLGQTAGKGNKGQLQRSGGVSRRGFEGGQTPLIRRLPKFGFTPLTCVDYDVVNFDQLNKFDGVVTVEALKKAGFKKFGKIKILARGKLEKKLTVSAHAFSKKAIEAIEKLGGKAEVVK